MIFQLCLQKPCWSHQVERGIIFTRPNLIWKTIWLATFLSKAISLADTEYRGYSLWVPSHLTLYNWPSVHMCYNLYINIYIFSKYFFVLWNAQQCFINSITDMISRKISKTFWSNAIRSAKKNKKNCYVEATFVWSMTADISIHKSESWGLSQCQFFSSDHYENFFFYEGANFMTAFQAQCHPSSANDLDLTLVGLIMVSTSRSLKGRSSGS